MRSRARNGFVPSASPDRSPDEPGEIIASPCLTVQRLIGLLRSAQFRFNRLMRTYVDRRSRAPVQEHMQTQ